ncbi:MAG TPA: DUF4956 domain-containing protein [Chloroflexi bacterium]|nr:DUF4956 domain-containing protein [Chloroflexota bacterium]
MDNAFDIARSVPIPITMLMVNLFLSILLSSILAWFYTRYGKSLSNRAKFAQTLPLLTLTTVLVISIVKLSVALSLGLVGTLSIVRFRTAIKEPEELLYLFMSIAIGLGIGAEQHVPIMLAMIVIMTYLFARTLVMPRPTRSNLYLNILTPAQHGAFSEINGLLRQHVQSTTLRRLDRSESTMQATYLIPSPGDDILVALMDNLATQFPACEFSFVEQESTFGG